MTTDQVSDECFDCDCVTIDLHHIIPLAKLLSKLHHLVGLEHADAEAQSI